MIDTAGAALACNVTPATIRQWVARGWLPAHGDRRRRLYTSADLLTARDRDTRTPGRLASSRTNCHAPA